MKKINFIDINIPIYNIGINFLYNCSEEEATKFFHDKYGVHNEIKSYTGFNQMIINPKKGWRVNLLWIEKIDFSIHSYATLVHELSHVALSTLNEVGITVDYNNQDVYCYLVDEIFETILIKLTNNHKKQNANKHKMYRMQKTKR
jgi:hypothetical protein